MCNFPHDDARKIKESGIGWKLFTYRVINDKPEMEGGKILLRPLTSSSRYSTMGKEVRWSDSRGSGKGFCFFLSEALATKAKRLWGDIGNSPFDFHYKTVMLKIKYDGGISKHLERRFVSFPTRIALCRQFKLFSSKKYTLG